MTIQHEKPTETMIDRNNTRVLVEFKDSIREQMAAVHAACRDFLARQGQTDASLPREIRIEIRASLDAPESPSRVPSVERSIECWDHTYPCGKGPSGYTYCTERVCMIVGPVTVESGHGGRRLEFGTTCDSRWVVHELAILLLILTWDGCATRYRGVWARYMLCKNVA